MSRRATVSFQAHRCTGPDRAAAGALSPQPVTTILFADNASSADRIMPNLWLRPADAVHVAAERHRPRANYAFVGGHGETRRFDTVDDPDQHLDLWNPRR